MDRPRRVVVGVSGSLGNMAAVHAAASAAVRSGRVLVAVNAWHSPGGEAVARRSPCPPLDAVVREDARSILADALASVRCGVETESLILRGQAERVLLAATDEDDLLVVGTGRQGNLARMIHGTVTRYCIAHARCPVLAVPPSDLTRDLSALAGQRARAISVSVNREGLRSG